jgi:peptide/nickel transport system permease protein
MNRLAVFGFVVIALLVVIAVFAPWIATQDIGATNTAMRYLPPSPAHWFGTDATGRDVFARVIYGARGLLRRVG